MSVSSATLADVKQGLLISTNAFDTRITNLIESGLADLGIAGVTGDLATVEDVLVLQAVITYCRMNFGEPDDYERLKRSYDEQKAQLQMATGYTVWSDADGQIECN